MQNSLVGGLTERVSFIVNCNLPLHGPIAPVVIASLRHIWMLFLPSSVILFLGPAGTKHFVQHEFSEDIQYFVLGSLLRFRVLAIPFQTTIFNVFVIYERRAREEFIVEALHTNVGLSTTSSTQKTL